MGNGVGIWQTSWGRGAAATAQAAEHSLGVCEQRIAGAGAPARAPAAGPVPAQVRGGPMGDSSEDGATAFDRQVASRADQAMEQYADGDEEAFGVLYDELAPRLRRYALGLTGSEPVAADVIQQTLLQMHLSRGRFVRGAAVLPWAYAIARNLVRDWQRRRLHEARADEERGEDDLAAEELLPDQLLENKQREQALAEGLQRVPAHLRDAFVLVNVEGLPVAQAAEVLGISPGNVKVRAHRARQLLIELDARRERGRPRAAGSGPC